MIVRNDKGEDIYVEMLPNGMVYESKPFVSKDMISPVRCTHCGNVYDLCDVEPIGRFADCTTFESPCCHKHVDDRTWKGIPDIKKL